MQFMLILTDERGRVARAEDPELFSKMAEFAMGLAAEGKIQGGAPLHAEEEGARVRVRDGKTSVTDGPFTETKEIVGGFFLIDADSQKEAIDIASRCPSAEIGFVEVREVLPVGPM
jgi:hypothetical protein